MNSSSTTWAKSFGVIILAVLAALTGSGCQSGSSGGASSTTRNLALHYYDRGDYAAAQRTAIRAHQTGTSATRDQAALIAGLSSYELGQHAAARTWLSPLTSGSDREVAGRAAAGLGLTGVAEGDYTTGARYFDLAGRKLTGNEAARANFFAGECYTMLGRLDAAQRAYQIARAESTDSELVSMIDRRLRQERGFAVQLGAFSNMGNAQRVAANGARRARSLGYPEPRVEETSDATGKSLYLVRVGPFQTETEAMTARIRFGGDAVVVRSIAEAGRGS